MAALGPPFVRKDERHGCMARGDHGLPKVSPGPAMPDRSMPCGWATPETAPGPYGCFRDGPQSRPAAVFYPLGHLTPYAVARCRGLEATLSIFPQYQLTLAWSVRRHSNVPHQVFVDRHWNLFVTTLYVLARNKLPCG
jgi:hypothetical protein